MSTNNKRSFFRLDFKHPLGAEVKLIGLDETEVNHKTVKAAVMDLSAGGARFYTDAPLPEESNLLVELKFIGLGSTFRLLGIVVRTIHSAEEHYEYCIQFSLDEPDTAALTSLVNQLAIKLRKTDTLSNCSFCTEEELETFLPLRSRTTG